MGIIIKPLVTEKMTAITDKLNRFGFVAVSYTHLQKKSMIVSWRTRRQYLITMK